MTMQYVDAIIQELDILAKKPISKDGINALHDFHRHLTRLAETFQSLESAIEDAPTKDGQLNAILMAQRCWDIADLINDAIKLHDKCYIDEMVGDVKKEVHKKD